MEKCKKQTIITIISSIALVLLTALNSYAQTATEPLDGNGTEASPYEINNLDNLYWISQNNTAWDKYFIQTADIDASSTEMWDASSGWTPIGNNDVRFTGHYDGDGFKITGLHINRPQTDNVGLFGHVGHNSNATTIKNVHLEDVTVKGARGAGSLAGRVTGNQYTRIENCSAKNGTVEGTGATGGLVGSNNSYMTNPGAAEGFRPGIFESWAEINVSLAGYSTQEDGKDKFGGLTGCNQKGMISNSYALGSVTADNGERIGGLAGCILLRGILINSYSTGTVSGENANDIGGLVGMVGTSNYAGTVSNSFWNTETSGMESSAGGTGKTTAEMQTKQTFTDADWDMIIVWDINGATNQGYPFLKNSYTPPGTWTWKTDAATNEWELNTNWQGEPASAPTENAAVIIPASISGEHPNLSEKATLYSIEIGENATLTINEGDTLIIKNNAEGNGSIAGDGIVIFSGNAPQQIPGFTFSSIEINNLNNASLNENITVTKELKMTAGLLDLNSYTITLGENAILKETESSRVYGISGTIETTRNLNAPSGENIGGMGLAITSLENLGNTIIARGHTEQIGDEEHVSIFRYFDINPANNENLDATLVFHYFFEELNGQGEADLALYKKDNETLCWIKADSEVDPDGKTITATAISSFSRWTAANSESNPLPVTWLEFKGERQDASKVLLDWSTASEINNDRFELQRSIDGKNFITVGYQTAAGNSTKTQSYRFNDYNAPASIVYYKVKQVDFDGKYDYSKTIVVEESIQQMEFKIYPNPVIDKINLVLPDYNDKAQIIIRDISGKQLYRMETSNSQTHLINASDWAGGIYFISVVYNDKVVSKRIVKQ